MLMCFDFFSKARMTQSQSYSLSNLGGQYPGIALIWRGQYPGIALFQGGQYPGIAIFIRGVRMPVGGQYDPEYTLYC